jgi:hypothetical protein
MPNAEDDDDDDVLGNDRNALRLKPEVARIMGNEARLLFHKGLWVISLVCLWIAGRARGSEVKLGDISHIHIIEWCYFYGSTYGGLLSTTVEQWMWIPFENWVLSQLEQVPQSQDPQSQDPDHSFLKWHHNRTISVAYNY